MRDLVAPLPDGARWRSSRKRSGEKALELIRHDAAHVLAAAVLELYGGVKISIGPPIDDGFYYDFEFPDGVTISEADFPQIEERMRAHVKAAEPFERRDVTPAQARERFVAEDQDYKVELIDDLVAQRSRRIRRGCSRPSRCTPTGRSPTSAADRTRRARRPSARSSCSRSRAPTGAGTPSARCSRASTARRSSPRRSSQEHLERIEQAKARDHRKLGRELGLFTFSELSPGAPFWQPAGMSDLERADRASGAR